MSLFVDAEEDTHESYPITTSNEEQRPHSPQNIQSNDNGVSSEDEEPSIPVVINEDRNSVPIYLSKEISCNLPLKFQQEIVNDVLSKDGLLLLARGLGLDTLTANLLHALYSPSIVLENGPHKREKKSLIFVLNTRSEERRRLGEELTELLWIDGKSDDNPLIDLTSEVQITSSKRTSIYAKGGIMAVTSRVLVVDFLSGALSANEITGLLILHAERIKETSNESFIINLYRDQNDWGFIKAISEDPESFTGFTPLASKLRILRLSNVFLWPRFHVEVSMSLNSKGKNLLNREKQKSEKTRYVTEINTKLSYKMNKIQSAILSCMQACLQELKRHNPESATEYWDMENVHDNNFVVRIRAVLEPQWHRLTYTTKQLVFDLSTLTDLLKYLVTLDSVSFYQVVQGIIDQNIKHGGSGALSTSAMSPWLSLDESSTIISYSRERAMGQVKVHKTETNNEGETKEIIQEEYVLEELPKWHQLGALLDDIMHEKSLKGQKDLGPILIMCSSSSTVKQLSSLITSMSEEIDPETHMKRYSFKRYMVHKLNSYLGWKKFSSLAAKINSELSTNDGKDGDEGSQEKGEQLTVSKTFSRNGQPVSKRRRTRGASTSARVSKLYTGSNSARNFEAVNVDESIFENLQKEVKAEDDQGIIYISDDESNDKGFPESNQKKGSGGAETEKESVDGEDVEILSHKFDDTLLFTHIDKDDQIILQTFNEHSNNALLQDLSPSYIVMYEPDLGFVRAVEIYQAVNKENPAKTYFMYYGTSVEEQKHLLRIKKEKEAFTRLIREKANLGKHFETAEDMAKFRVKRNHVANTRIAGGIDFRSEQDPLRVIVDVREFTSSLPGLLYRVGIDVIPCMLTVGDYILSPKICIERKSIPDLISSFKSGRLFHQCEQMFRHYELPTLLIEFDESKSFSLEPFSDSRFQRVNPTNPAPSQMMQQSIQSKIMSLLISYPKLKIIWSSSPTETAQIVLTLKGNQPEPSINDALDKGVNRSLGTEDGGPPAFNEAPIDFIQTIPGINNENCFSIIKKIKSIEELVKLDKPQFIEILGEENGRKAFNFINHEVT
ncbi:uncharacterized protein PRCAT00004533001 [Priceomyces carsonii]|uniref:uncharacterized protein n=1 Tax=Priceomyces carsonii TaxID=28549 RepID=UPI002ED7B6A1|nr:unnamed protein product [Priceomyces carsonii]